MQINVRVLNAHGNEISGAGFIYARQAGCNRASENIEAMNLAKQKMRLADRVIFDSISHPNEIKIWVH